MPERHGAPRHLVAVRALSPISPPGPALERLAAPLLARCSFPPARATLACAVSGGADSLCLLALGVASGCEVTAYHVDHGLRPDSAAEADVVADAAGRLGAGFVALRVDVSSGPNLEARARAARRAALPEDAATGHTADDQAETVLLNLLRGAGLDGLAGMRPGRLHPILGLRRAEAATFVAALGLSAVRDPSNDDPAFARNRVRHELLPLCCDIAGRDVAGIIVRQAGLLALEADTLEAAAASLEVTDASALAAAPVALARRAVRAWLRDGQPERHPPGLAAVERVLAVARGEVVACELPGGRRVRRSAGRLLVEVPAATSWGAARIDDLRD